MKPLLSIFVACCLLPTAYCQQPTAYFLSSPALSPDAKTLVFSFEGDLWRADVSNGEATRLTAMQGYETNARFSPDGKWIAFTGRQFGNADVFVIPVGGGEIRQVTFHAGNDDVENWSWDSKTLYFTSSRYNSGTVYSVPLAGGNPVRLFDHYFNTIHNLAVSPVTGELFFNSTWESQSQANRKHYKGEYNPDIQSYNPKTGEYKKYTEWPGKDMWATVDKNGTVYFVSDELNDEYNLYKLDNGKPKNLTAFKTSMKRPIVSADGSKVVFEKDYQLFIYDAAAGKSEKLAIRINRNNLLPKEQSFATVGKISDFDVSPDNKKMAFISRGDLFVSDVEGKFIKSMRTVLVERGPGLRRDDNADGEFERVVSVKWLSDNKTLLYNMTWNGYLNWFTVAADGTGMPKQLTKDMANNRDIEFNKDLTKAAYISGRDELRLMDLKTMESRLLVKDEFWGFQNGSPGFSPDGEYVLYTAKRNFEDDIFVIHIRSGVITNLTNTGVAESGPVWSGDGKYIYFASNRTKPTYPSGGGPAHVYRFALDRVDAPFRTDEFDKLWKPEPGGKKTEDGRQKTEDGKTEDKKDTVAAKKDTITPITINTDRIWERYELVSPGYGSQGGPFVMQKAEKTTILFVSDHDKGAGALWKTVLSPWEPAKTEKIEGAAPGSIVKAGDKLYMLTAGIVYKLNVDGNKADKIDIQNVTFTRNLAAEFRQMFEETWANMEGDYYHENLHGADWPAYKAHYGQFLPFLNNRNDFRVLMADMLGELNSSHQGFSSSGDDEQPSRLNYQTMETGILWEESAPFTVKRIATRSTADISRLDIQPGDVLVKINKESIDTSLPRDFYFYGPTMPPELNLTFSRKGTEYTAKIHPMSAGQLSGNLYDEWVDGNRRKVNELSKNKIAYHQMKDMGGGSLENFLMAMTRDLQEKDGLILDLRFNTGGNVHDEVLKFLSQRTYLQWKARGGKLANQSNFAPSDKPIVMLINEQSLSDAEMTSAGFKALKLGTIVGTETYRWIIFTSGKGLVDGSFYRMPGWGCYTLDGDDLEFTGVKPDIYVKTTFMDRMRGKDPQLEKAVEVILER